MSCLPSNLTYLNVIDDILVWNELISLPKHVIFVEAASFLVPHSFFPAPISPHFTVAQALSILQKLYFDQTARYITLKLSNGNNKELATLLETNYAKAVNLLAQSSLDRYPFMHLLTYPHLIVQITNESVD